MTATKEDCPLSSKCLDSFEKTIDDLNLPISVRSQVYWLLEMLLVFLQISTEMAQHLDNAEESKLLQQDLAIACKKILSYKKAKI